ncbi:unnamed protein product [Caenorhabditis angaria]|uniref:Essential MCU regulator, mitochondrial n=1 Tax=Caenorhabditis angaria TaxID=860376 RepID=A0A9P1J1C6_9PELO|nr:unnamed protein product [Caenorhabditis angaria]
MLRLGIEPVKNALITRQSYNIMSTANLQTIFKGVVRFVAQQMANPQGNTQVVQSLAPGNIQQRPFSNRAGLFKLFAVCTSSLYLGGMIAHKGASFLEENEIFVPAEDDDDD